MSRFYPNWGEGTNPALLRERSPFEGLIIGYPDVRDVLILTLVAFYDTLLVQIICTYCNAASGGRP
jgi:hypothetical protein